MVAAFLLFNSDQLLIADIAEIMNSRETWVREARDYIERRVRHYYAFQVYSDPWRKHATGPDQFANRQPDRASDALPITRDTSRT